MIIRSGNVYHNFTILDEFITFIEPFQSVNEILNFSDWKDNPQMKGIIYEKLWDIVLKCGCFNEFPNNEYWHYEGNPLTSSFKKIVSLTEYFRHPHKHTGKSDFHMQNKKSGEMIFNSCKCYEEEKSPDNYDIRVLKQILDENRFAGMYKIGGIFLINREEFIKRNVASLYELKDIKVFDLKDLEIAFAKFKLLNKNIDYDSRI